MADGKNIYIVNRSNGIPGERGNYIFFVCCFNNKKYQIEFLSYAH